MIIVLDKKSPNKNFHKMVEKSFGEYIKILRERNGYPLRKVAAVLDIDPSTLSKIERGTRSANKEMLSLFSTLFNVESELLNLIFISDKVVTELINEENIDEIMKVVAQKIKRLKERDLNSINLIQTND